MTAAAIGAPRGRFVTGLAVYRLPGPGDLLQLMRPLVYVARDGRTFEVPAGMIADGNSGPVKHADGEPAGWLHDWLYRLDCRAGLSRAEADALFREALEAEGFSRAFAWLQWAAVRAFGASSWHRKRVHPI